MGLLNGGRGDILALGVNPGTSTVRVSLESKVGWLKLDSIYLVIRGRSSSVLMGAGTIPLRDGGGMISRKEPGGLTVRSDRVLSELLVVKELMRLPAASFLAIVHPAAVAER